MGQLYPQYFSLFARVSVWDDMKQGGREREGEEGGGEREDEERQKGD